MILYSDNKALIERLARFEDNYNDIRVTRLHAWIRDNFPQLQFQFIPGDHNALADALSRYKSTVSSSPVIADDALQQIWRVHSQGHFSAKQTYAHLRREGYNWPGLHTHVEEVVRSCPQCQHFSKKKLHDVFHGALPHAVNELLFMDVAGPYSLPHGRSTRHILVIVDAFSRLLQATLIKQPTSQAVIKGLSEWKDNVGLPQRIQTDNATYFSSIELEAWLKVHDIQHIFSAPYEAHSNGIVERSIGNLKLRFKKCLFGESKSWTTQLSRMVHYINNAVNRNTNFSPNELAWGRRRTGEHISEGALADWRAQALQNTIRSQKLENDRLMKRYHIQPRLQEGDLVLWNVPPAQQATKGPFDSQWDGPYELLNQESRFIWNIRHLNTGQLVRRVHTHQIKRFFQMSS